MDEHTPTPPETGEIEARLARQQEANTIPVGDDEVGTALGLAEQYDETVDFAQLLAREIEAHADDLPTVPAGDFQELVRVFTDTVGEAAATDTDDARLRRLTHADPEEWSFIFDSLLVEAADDPEYAFLLGYPTERAVIPAAVTVGGAAEYAYAQFGHCLNALTESVDRRGRGRPEVMCDGGEDLCFDCEDSAAEYEVGPFSYCEACLVEWAETEDRGEETIRDAGHGDVMDRNGFGDEPDRVGGGSDGSTRDIAHPVALTNSSVIDRITEQGWEIQGGRFEIAPRTQEVWDRTEEAIHKAVLNDDTALVTVPTGGGKSYAAATTNWGLRDGLTDGRQVVILHNTRDARDEAAADAREAGNDPLVLQGRSELCPLAKGRLDPNGEGDQTITVDGVPGSEYVRKMCDGKGVAFSAVHQYVDQHNDQDATLSCTCNGACPAQEQHERRRDGDHDLVIATNNFAFVPGLRYGKHLIIDEMPDFQSDLSHSEIETAVRAYLEEINAPYNTLGGLIRSASHENLTQHEMEELERTRNLLEQREPEPEWFIETEGAHTLAPGIIRALTYAEQQGPPGYVCGKATYCPPRLDANAQQSDLWNMVRLSVVVNASGEVTRVRSVPDFFQTRSLVGLDAHPEKHQWEANTVDSLHQIHTLSAQERQLWRRSERGLTTVQVGDAERPVTDDRYHDPNGSAALVEAIRDEHGDDFRTAITSLAVEGFLTDELRMAGADDPETMHYGNVKSRNDFADESVGLVHGCVDPGDEFVLSTLAERGLEASPERADVCCDHCGDREDAPEEPGHGCGECSGTGMAREKGRGFVGEDADAAESILDSVRGSLVAQAIGRWARGSGDGSTVYVRTSVAPDHMIDCYVPGVEWVYGDQQREIVAHLRDADTTTAREIAEAVGCSKQHALDTLDKLCTRGLVTAEEGAGKFGATVWEAGNLPATGTASVQQTTNRDVEDQYNVTVGGLTLVDTGDSEVQLPWGETEDTPAQNTPKDAPKAGAEGGGGG